MKAALPWKKIILGLLLAAAVFTRLYNLENTLQFQGDQGRDAIIVADIFRQKDPVFIGPVTSVGNLYLGPLYYYFMLPFLWLTYPSPMGPAYAVALLGVATVYLVYRLGKKIIGENAALVAAFFYTFSAAITMNTRFSWNPNPAPFVSMIMVYATFLAWKKQPRWWIVVFACFSVLVQLHYLTLLTLPAFGTIWLMDAIGRWKIPLKEKQTRWQALWPLLRPTLIGVLIFLLSLTPLVLFDIKHDGRNLKAFQTMVGGEESFAYRDGAGLIGQASKVLKENEGRAMHIFFEYLIGKNRPLNKTVLYASLLVLILTMKDKRRRGKELKGEWVLLSFLGWGVLGTALYKHTVFDHYIAYLFPLAALYYGYVLTRLKPRWAAWLAGVMLTGYFLWYNLPKMPLKDAGWTLNDIQKTSEVILDKVPPGTKYNLVLLSESRDIEGQNYRYFLTTGHTRPVPTQERDNTEILFIINEEKKIDRVIDSPIYEIVVFPDKEPAEIFTIPNGPEITVLTRTVQPPSEPLE